MKNLILLVSCALFGLALGGITQLEGYTFERYLGDFQKVYAPEELEFRKGIFEANLEKIKRHNQDGTKTWKMGVNHMADWTPQEFKNLLGARPERNLRSSPFQLKFDEPMTPVEDLPTSVDWRTKNVVTAVKNQGSCGSCWSFGTAETVESFYALKSGNLVVLSEQQILDCTPNPNDCGGTGGCGGGTAELAYAEIIAKGGLSSEQKYPYISGGGNNYKCKFSNASTPPVAKLSGFTVLPSNQYAPVMNALANVGPLAINVDASSWSFYDSGIYSDCPTDDIDIDHVVQLVGYGVDSNTPYWIVRNSWGKGWGEQGYMKLKRNPTPTCGKDPTPADGTGCNGGPPSVTVCGECGILYDVSYPVIA